MNKNWLAVVALGVVGGFATTAVADHDHGGGKQQRVFRAKLVGVSEVPSVSTVAEGQFYAVVNQAGRHAARASRTGAPRWR